MESLRRGSAGSVPLRDPCCRCGNADSGWDRIADKPYCPNCQEMLILGESEPLSEPTEKNPCAACGAERTISFQTLPQQSNVPVLMDLCAEHLRGLLARQLGPYAFSQLRRRLAGIHLTTEDFFLLHSAFYDAQGRALQPALDA